MNLLPSLAVGLLAAFLFSCGETASSHLAAQQQNRKILGQGVDYVPLGNIEASALKSSLQLRRGKAWDILRAILLPTHASPTTELLIPAWLTWYDRDEVGELFRRYLVLAATKGCAPEDSLCREQAITEAFEQEATYVDESIWDEKALADYIKLFRTSMDVTGLSEPDGEPVVRILYSPAAVRHILREYEKILACEPEVADTDAGCALNFPPNAVILKTEWQLKSKMLNVVETNTSGLEKMLASGSWQAAIKTRIAGDTLQPGDILTMRTHGLGEAVTEYVLTGLHAMAKETHDWVWVTMWWGDEPDSDFGADRPASFQDLDSPWRHYKMCASGSYEEGDTEEWRELLSRPETLSLGQAVETVFAKSGSRHTWCSNPYLEKPAGHAPTNCMGCHQDAGTTSDPRETPLRRPDHGRGQIRSRFPADYVWSVFYGPESLKRMMARIHQRIHRR